MAATNDRHAPSRRSHFRRNQTYGYDGDGVRFSRQVGMGPASDSFTYEVGNWEAVFQPYVLVDQVRSRGSGIGLFAARRLMEAMGGRTEVLEDRFVRRVQLVMMMR